MILKNSSTNSPSGSSKQTNSSSAVRDRKLDRFATPASITYNRYGEPIVGLPDRAAKRIVRHEVEGRAQPEERVAGKKMVFGPPELPPPPPARKVKRTLNPTYISSPDNPLAGTATESPYQKVLLKVRTGSQRCAARQKFESINSARRESQNRSSNFMNNQAACLEMERISWRTQHCGRRL